MTRPGGLTLPSPATRVPVPAAVPRRPVGGTWWPTVAVVTVLALASAAIRLPLASEPLSSDEGGFLMVAGQWAPGTSLYGDYWVDRPPLLITLFQLAGGSTTGLRLLGAGCVGASVLLAAAVARAALRLTGPSALHLRAAMIGAAAAAGTFLVSPLFGALEVDGEILAVPFVLAGLTAALTAHTTPRHAPAWWVGAGVLAVAAAAVKQNMLEVFVAVTVLLAVRVRRHPRAAAGAGAAFGAGALASALVLLGWAELHGTTPAGLWDAVVSFRLEAASVIARSAPATDRARAVTMATAWLGSGAVVVVLLGLVPRWRGRGPRPGATLLAVTAGVLLWELVGVVAGGSYWLHYLVGTVPGLVLAVATAAVRGRGRLLGAVLAGAGAVSVVGLVAVMTTSAGTPASTSDLERYLSGHARPGDTGITAFGDPALLQAADLRSPYPQLWSLPVRVRDPRLAELTRLLRGPDRPTWVVVDGDSLASWGIDPTSAQPALERHYRMVHTAGDWHVYHRRAQDRRPPA